MFLLENLLVALAKIVEMVLTLYLWIIIIRAVVSWVNADPHNPIVQLLIRITEPVLAPVRRWLPLRGLGIDFSPVVVILAIVFLQTFLVRSMMHLAVALR